MLVNITDGLLAHVDNLADTRAFQDDPLPQDLFLHPISTALSHGLILYLMFPISPSPPPKSWLQVFFSLTTTFYIYILFILLFPSQHYFDHTKVPKPTIYTNYLQVLRSLPYPKLSPWSIAIITALYISSTSFPLLSTYSLSKTSVLVKPNSLSTLPSLKTHTVCAYIHNVYLNAFSPV